MKKLLSCMMALAVLFLGLTSCEIVKDKNYEPTENGCFVFDKCDGGYSVKAQGNMPESVKVPEYYNGEKVVKIADNAFKGHQEIKSLELPVTVETVGEKAFYSCKSLEKLTFREEISFNLSADLKDDYNGNTNKGVRIMADAFGDCEKLYSVVFSKHVISIGAGAFYNTAVKTLVMTNVKVIEKFAFQHCKSLKTVKIPSTTTSIAYGTDGIFDEEYFTAFDKDNNIVFTVSEGNPSYKTDGTKLSEK